MEGYLQENFEALSDGRLKLTLNTACLRFLHDQLGGLSRRREGRTDSDEERRRTKQLVFVSAVFQHVRRLRIEPAAAKPSGFAWNAGLFPRLAHLELSHVPLEGVVVAAAQQLRVLHLHDAFSPQLLDHHSCDLYVRGLEIAAAIAEAEEDE